MFLTERPPTRDRILSDETGAVAVIFALLLVVFIVFSAFTVDLGMAWAQRREAQTAADAGAMAGILSQGDIVGEAMDFVEANVSSITPLAWDSCPNPDPVFASYTDEAGNPLNFVLVDPSLTNCVWVSTGETEENELYVAVRTPNLPVDTALARVIGIDTIDVDAFAISRTKTTGEAAVLPFTIPVNAPTHSCLGSAPAGIARNPCSGASSGNFGYIQSPTHGTKQDFGTENSCDGQPNALAVLEMNIALGTDHPMFTDETYPTSPSADADFPDTCDGKNPPAWEINSIVTLTGNSEAEMHAGLVSNATFGTNDGPSRLQLPVPSSVSPATVLPRRTIMGPKNGDLSLDNVGLWEYIKSGSNLCNQPASLWDAGGEPATEALITCLDSVDKGTSSLTFESSLLESPRFAVIPQLWGDFPSGTSEPRAIKQFRGVYLQATWFNCSASSSVDKCVQFEDVEGDMQPIFFPGEGDVAACNGDPLDCKKDATIAGLTALLLPVNASPSGIIDLGPDSDQIASAELVR